MEKLNFIVDWGGDKINAWSGTRYSIFCALQKYFDVNELQTSNEYKTLPHTLYGRIRNRLKYEYHRLVDRFIRPDNKEDFDLARIFCNRKYYKNIKGLVFQFEEILSDTRNRNTVIYQDFCAEYLEEMKHNNPEILAKSGFGYYSSEAISQRYRMQLKYFDNCAAIFCMGKWLADYMSAKHPEWKSKIYHVGGGVNLDQSKIDPNPNKTHNKILYVGRDYRLKGGIDTIEAFKKLKAKRPDLELHFCGPKRNPVEGELDGYYYYGNASRETLQRLMNDCDLFCMPSYMEGYGIAIIESLSFGLPCIGRNVYEMPYLIQIGETGELVETNSIDELADKIETVLSNPAYAENVQSKREFYVKEYSWDTVAKRMADVIKKI